MLARRASITFHVEAGSRSGGLTKRAANQECCASETIDAAARNRIGGRDNCQAGIYSFKQYQMSWHPATKTSRRFSSNHVLAQPKRNQAGQPRPADAVEGESAPPIFHLHICLLRSGGRDRARRAMPCLFCLSRAGLLSGCQPMKISSLLLCSLCLTMHA